MDKFPPLLSEANKAMERCVELAPESADAWTALLTIRALSKVPESANQTLRDAQLALSEDQLMDFWPRGYEIMGRWFDAENMYTTAFEARPDDYFLMRTLATFYRGSGYPLTDGTAKAAPFINDILRAGAEGKIPQDDPSLQWARRTAAQIFADTRSYPELIKAEKLLSSNAQNGTLPSEDSLTMARLLSMRPEPVSRVKAVKLFETLKQDGPLSSADELALGRLYFGLNDWTKCRNQMRETIGRYRDWTAPRKLYVRMLVQRGSPRELDEAREQLVKLQELDKSDLESVELAVRLMTKQGKPDFARSNLMKIIPKVDDPKKITEQQAKELEMIAQLFVGLEDYDQAEKIYRLLVAYQTQARYGPGGFLGPLSWCGPMFHSPATSL